MLGLTFAGVGPENNTKKNRISNLIMNSNPNLVQTSCVFVGSRVRGDGPGLKDWIMKRKGKI